MPKVGKSITVNFFANQQIKPKTITWKGEIVEVYPLSASIIYGHASSIVKVEKSGMPILVTVGLEQIEEPELKEFTDHFRANLIDIVTKEIKLFGKEFTIKGIGSRLKKYNQPIISLAGTLTIADVQNWHIDLLDDEKISTDALKDAGNVFAIIVWGLFTNKHVKSISVYDWLFGSGKETMDKILAERVILVRGEKYIIKDSELEALFSLLDWLAIRE